MKLKPLIIFPEEADPAEIAQYDPRVFVLANENAWMNSEAWF